MGSSDWLSAFMMDSGQTLPSRIFSGPYRSRMIGRYECFNAALAALNLDCLGPFGDMPGGGTCSPHGGSLALTSSLGPLAL